MKIFIYSSEWRTLKKRQLEKILSKIKPGSTIRTSGSNGLDSIVTLIEYKNNISIEIYIPWEGFNGYKKEDETNNITIKCPKVSKKAMDILDKSILGSLKPKYVKIDNRLVTGILGEDLDDPVDLVVINNIDSILLPTTSSALVERLAFDNGIKYINLEYSTPKDLENLII